MVFRRGFSLASTLLYGEVSSSIGGSSGFQRVGEDQSWAYWISTRAVYPPPHFTVSFEGLHHRLSLRLILPEVPKEVLLFGVVLTYPLQSALHEPVKVGRV